MILKVGDRYEYDFSISQEEVNEFAKITGDTNPVHVDPEFAKTSEFGRTVIHGVFGLSIISRVMGTQWPGEGSLYLGQNIEFKGPMYPGDMYRIELEVKRVIGRLHIAVVETNIRHIETDQLVVKGEAKAMNKKTFVS
ncbi:MULTISPECIES: MaoC family dehydratase [Persicobacter]|uniref:3-hydroxybutyryl-CoA dehydratase n=1 Tax=Persicobacter diffluens TaxID=981 RepID=A0AAN4VYT6_9BACT|nr:MaoC family dehydratase [Persicobacter sp. CCB-QB2]GJM61561.1 3-hydroxybutyryl-CoA dehydratase [Persicobacter diffluens]